jgi:TfoX/Sxy family transcriptional regulator of competence genes
MAYDEGLAQRIREALAPRRDVSEKVMFGGIAFMVGGNMAVGIVKEDLMVRVAPEAHLALLSEPHARPMSPEGVESDADLNRWIERGTAYAASLPAK